MPPRPTVLPAPREATGGGLGYGGDYNPEQWPEDVWVEDARLMREAGVTFVTLGVFAWARIEPRPGVRDLDWLERVMDLMHEHGIAVDLATATASPPAWLMRAHPEMLPVTREGLRLTYGSRQSWCPSSPVYREHSLALVTDLAERFADHPALALWHVSNELGCHNAHCYCEISAASFRRWLRTRYGDVEALNDAWGTTFWSQHYDEWDEVQPPRSTTALPNPTQLLDFRRFSSEELLGQHIAEREVLRRHTPDVPVTTNFMVSGHIDGMDYWRWAPHQDVVSNDHYLDGSLPAPHVELSFCADWTRGLAGGAPWILMEHSTSAVNWQPRNYAKAPGQMRRNTLQHVARGADAVGFFQWRASVAGAEKYHSAMLPHAGTDSRVWRETVELGSALARLGEVAGTRVQADVALLADWESWWAVERPSMPSTDVTYLDRVHALYAALWAAGVTVDVHHPAHDLAGYRLVVAPTLHLLSGSDADRLTSYVRDGGHLLTTYFSGIVDEHDHVGAGGYPAALREVLGIRVEEFLPLPPGQQVTLRDDARPDGTADTWVEHLHLAGASAVRTYADGPCAGQPAVTRHELGSGLGWYVATRTDPSTTSALVREVLAAAGVTGSGLPDGVEVVRRSGMGRSYLFVLNHTSRDVTVPAEGTDLLGAGGRVASVSVPAGSVACVREDGS